MADTSIRRGGSAAPGTGRARHDTGSQNDTGPAECPVSLRDAVALATRAHAGQLDKVGDDYIGHPLRVMEAVGDAARRAGVDPDQARMVAVLHDVVEDTDVTLATLTSLGYPSDVVAAVDALSHRDGESVEHYLARVADNALSVVVKRADMADNSNPVRLARLPRDQADRYARRYSSRIRLLDDLVAQHGAAVRTVDRMRTV
ncbi:HD domain-containing protein [Frankia sp. Cr1]|uniref:HD domain-containing protein n=1 Tax=Frankia sp. Cr1 TaxID=3073931 RepID=UPI002AD48A29|nr:HD domain-containing protein [Frankia sp. Cr1]